MDKHWSSLQYQYQVVGCWNTCVTLVVLPLEGGGWGVGVLTLIQEPNQAMEKLQQIFNMDPFKKQNKALFHHLFWFKVTVNPKVCSHSND